MTISVLVVDDSKTLCRSLGTLLSEAGYSAATARSGEEGLRLWQEIQPELVITDVMMPERDGIEMIMDIRRHRPQAKILAMTAFRHSGTVDFADMLRRLGADDVLIKPFAPEVLLTKVDRLISLPTALFAA
ncbi:MAG TPA: response regulator [Stellaceae bacterium]|nr:response regulator [Stellaceae bacterium]